jgi:formylglycine-generating enzyme required for sulfatase activity
VRRAVAAAIVLVVAGIGVAVVVARQGEEREARCGEGFAARGARCVPGDPARCPPPLAPTEHGCDAPDVRVLVPATSLAVGASDWEAEGRVAARTLHVQAFRVDAFEVTRGRQGLRDDPARAASAMTRAEAAGFCAAEGGRLPTEDEWMVAAASAMNPPRRYPWGDTGAVCRRAAWGLATGPCARGADGPDTVGAHPDGDSPLGLHDLAGNVAEWVAAAGADPGPGVAKGGSWADGLASDLRIWARLEVDPGARDPRVGLRCAYPP